MFIKLAITANHRVVLLLHHPHAYIHPHPGRGEYLTVVQRLQRGSSAERRKCRHNIRTEHFERMTVDPRLVVRCKT